MTKAEFERQINAFISKPNPQTTSALFAFGQELGQAPDCDGVRDLLNALNFIFRHFDEGVLHSTYELIQHDTAALPGELVGAAVLLQSGDDPETVSELIQRGHLLGFYAPKDANAVSPLAVCCVVEDGKLHLTYTEHFGSFDPEKVLRDARGYAGQHGISVLETLIQHTASDGTVGQAVPGAQMLLSDSQPEVTRAMADNFSRCPAVAAQMILDTCWGITVVERNPLWREQGGVQREPEENHGPEMAM